MHNVFRHRNGGTYTVLGSVNGYVYYVAHSGGELWYRPHEEFYDGRFVPSDECPLMPDEIGAWRG